MAKHISVFLSIKKKKKFLFFVFKIFPGWEYTFFCDSEGSLSVSKVVAITLSLFFVLIFAIIIAKIRKCFGNSSQTNSGGVGSNPDTNTSSEVALAMFPSASA